MELSIVVPVYNVEKYLRRCIESLVHQTILLKKIILVDDGSTDGSGQICDEYAAKYENIQVIHQKNQGLSAARNTGIELVDTELIGFVDSDDYIEHRMYEALVSDLTKNDADIAIGGVYVEKENGEKYNKAGYAKACVLDTKSALIELNSYRLFNMACWDKIYKTELWDGIPFPVGKLCEDYYVMHRIIARAKRITYTSEPFYHYIQRQNSISRNKKINLAPMEASMVQMQFYQKEFPDIAYVAETACAFSHMGIYTAHVRNDVPCPADLLKKCRKVSRRYLKSVLKNSYIPKIKKFQALAFCYGLPIYKYTVKRREHR